MRTTRRSKILFAVALAGITSSAAYSQVLDLDSLKSVQRGFREAKRDLMEPQIRQEALADSLSRAIALHRKNSVSGELIETLIRLDANCRALDESSQQRERLELEEAKLQPLLRAAYDWEISSLFAVLRDAHDEGLLLQLNVFQEERKALGDEIVDSPIRFGEDLALSDADGPDEIEQKIELLEGMADRHERKAQEIAKRLSTLEEESRLARIISRPTRVSSRREDTVPLTHQLTSQGGATSSLLPEVALLQESHTPNSATVVQASITRMEPTARVRKGSFTQDLQIEMLKVKQRELLQIQTVVQGQIATFRLRLEQLLEDSSE